MKECQISLEDQRARSNLFTHDGWKEFGWTDEVHDCLGRSSVDLWDLYVIDPTARPFVEFLVTNKSAADCWPSAGEAFTPHISIAETMVTLKIQSLRDMEAFYLSQADAARLFYGRPFTAAPTNNALGTP